MEQEAFGMSLKDVANRLDNVQLPEIIPLSLYDDDGTGRLVYYALDLYVTQAWKVSPRRETWS